MYSIEEVNAADTLPLILSLIVEHEGDLGYFPGMMEVPEAGPNIERYAQLQAAGVLVAVVAKCEGQIVGYATSILLNHPHFKGLLMLMNDALFVSKAHRKSGVGRQIMQYVEGVGKSRGARVVTWTAKVGTALDVVLPKMGYAALNVTYSKEV